MPIWLNCKSRSKRRTRSSHKSRPSSSAQQRSCSSVTKTRPRSLGRRRRARSRPPPRTSCRQARVDLGWNIDLFWCAGDAAAQNQSKAEAIERILIEEQKRQSQAGTPSGVGLAFPIGRVRVRTLDETTNARSGYRIQSDVIRADRNELEQAEALRRFVTARQGPTLGDAKSAMGTSYYLSAFLCGAPGQ